MLRGKGQGIDGDPEVTALAAATLEAAFRAEWQNRQWPDLSGVVTYYSEAVPLDSTTVQVVTLLQLSSGAKECTVVKLARRGSEWRVFTARRVVPRLNSALGPETRIG
jgi:hypothetical protein